MQPEQISGSPPTVTGDTMSVKTVKRQRAPRSPAPADVIRPPETNSLRGHPADTRQLYEIANYSCFGPMTKPKRQRWNLPELTSSEA